MNGISNLWNNFDYDLFKESLFCLVESFPKIIFNAKDMISARIGYPTVCIEKNSDISVILFHGRNSNQNQYTKIVDTLQKFNVNIHGLTLSSGSTKISEDVNQIFTTFSDKIIGKNIIAIGISKGGLTALDFCVTHRDQFKSIKVITIASPLNGTKITKFTSCINTKNELGYKSEYTKDLYDKVKECVGLDNVYHIVPKHDHVIIPYSSCQYEDTNIENIYYCQHITNHGSVQFDTIVINKLDEWINKIMNYPFTVVLQQNYSQSLEYVTYST